MSIFYKIAGRIAGSMPKAVLRARYFKTHRRWLNFSEPQDGYARVLVNAYNNRNNPQWAELADKWAVRRYVADRVGEKYLIPSLGHWERAEDIDFNALPNSFVLKTNNGCASNILVRDKASADTEAIRKKMAKFLQVPYGEFSGQLHYSLIKPCILAEKLLVQSSDDVSLIDYKIHVKNGEIITIMVMSNRRSFSYNLEEFDTEWNRLTRHVNPEAFPPVATKRPQAFEEMKKVALKLAEGVDLVRVDLYEVDGKVYFGEMSFTPGYNQHAYNQETIGELTC